MFDEECHHPITNPVSGGFKEDFIPRIYDELEDGHPNDVHEEC